VETLRRSPNAFDADYIRAMVSIVQAQSGPQVAQVRALFLEYARSLDFDLCFQNFEEEVAALPGGYSPPQGRLLLALMADEPVGCVGVRRLAEGICEMKRLYVRAAFRRAGLGRKLCGRLVEEARLSGYSAMRLDTVPSMTEAIALYESLGFQRIGPYRENPVCGAIFFELRWQQ
jgi:carbonic anhydrase